MLKLGDKFNHCIITFAYQLLMNCCTNWRFSHMLFLKVLLVVQCQAREMCSYLTTGDTALQHGLINNILQLIAISRSFRDESNIHYIGTARAYHRHDFTWYLSTVQPMYNMVPEYYRLSIYRGMIYTDIAHSTTTSKVKLRQQLWVSFVSYVEKSDRTVHTFIHTYFCSWSIVSKFCTLCGSDAVVQYAQFRNDWATESDVMDGRCLSSRWVSDGYPIL